MDRLSAALQVMQVRREEARAAMALAAEIRALVPLAKKDEQRVLASVAEHALSEAINAVLLWNVARAERDRATEARAA